MAEGKSNRQIAGELYISLKTVERHITNIGNTLGRKGRGRVRVWLENELSHAKKSKNNRDAH